MHNFGNASSNCSHGNIYSHLLSLAVVPANLDFITWHQLNDSQTSHHQINYELYGNVVRLFDSAILHQIPYWFQITIHTPMTHIFKWQLTIGISFVCIYLQLQYVLEYPCDWAIDTFVIRIWFSKCDICCIAVKCNRNFTSFHLCILSFNRNQFWQLNLHNSISLQQ